ncbi:hypothetical protein LY78DRAFT_96945 [Colletotrichum sublineola]|nr:hypothetical protein LY78DRAFT_96945 [Colletotrichum sublineola]
MTGCHETHEQRWRISVCTILGSSAIRRSKATEDHQPLSRVSLVFSHLGCLLTCAPYFITLGPFMYVGATCTEVRIYKKPSGFYIGYNMISPCDISYDDIRRPLTAHHNDGSFAKLPGEVGDDGILLNLYY